jgi:hypothetical protein
MFQIQVVRHIPQLSPQPEGKIFWEEIINEAERSKDQVDEKRGHFRFQISNFRLKLQIRNPHSEIRIGLPLFSLIGKGFVDQHHGDIIFNGKEQVTGLADEAISFAIQENISLTFRAGQNFQEFFTDRHLHPPLLRNKKTLV